MSSRQAFLAIEGMMDKLLEEAESAFLQLPADPSTVKRTGQFSRDKNGGHKNRSAPSLASSRTSITKPANSSRSKERSMTYLMPTIQEDATYNTNFEPLPVGLAGTSCKRCPLRPVSNASSSVDCWSDSPLRSKPTRCCKIKDGKLFHYSASTGTNSDYKSASQSISQDSVQPTASGATPTWSFSDNTDSCISSRKPEIIYWRVLGPNGFTGRTVPMEVLGPAYPERINSQTSTVSTTTVASPVEATSEVQTTRTVDSTPSNVACNSAKSVKSACRRKAHSADVVRPVASNLNYSIPCEVLTKKVSFPTRDGQRLRGYTAEFSVTVENPDAGGARELHFRVECPDFKPGRVWLNGKLMR